MNGLGQLGHYLCEELLLFPGSAAPAVLPHGGNLAEIVWAALGGLLSAAPTEGNGSGVFLGHLALRLKQALAVCQGWIAWLRASQLI